jgi:hypothetical protein
MSHALRTSVDIDAPPGRVWEVLADLGAHAAWNPFITRADGALQVGARLALTMQPVGARRVRLRPTVLEVTPGRRLRWLGRAGVRGVLDAEHTFTLSERGDHGTRLEQDEVFRGLLVPVLRRSLDRHTLPAFRAMDEALKERAEHGSSARAG